MFVFFYVCSIININVCRHEVIQISEQPLTPTTCLKYAQPQLANWNKWHPNLNIQKWKCLDQNRKDQEMERIERSI